ncbi:MAG: A/G-specific adenine glycosylase [Treponema sp.]|jgi:A/G-specific adenine glycosylase|nr:A/G-specific adenine glycosylase [Treponema sp.]
MLLSKRRVEDFRKTILDFYAASGRSFPWRYGAGGEGDPAPDPWGVLVSEFMLQQTQTRRVLAYWERWMELWPGPAELAAADLGRVLKEWSGLGYNRRAKNLRECARLIAERHGGRVPGVPEELITLPGIGPYTAGAIACFAWNYPAVFIETNIRSTVIHFFFQDQAAVKDSELIPVLSQCLDRSNPRVWYWALMDYGAELKRVTKNPGRKSAGYVRQSRFEGSFRQIRGAVIRALSVKGPLDAPALRGELAKSVKDMAETDYYKALEVLERELMVAEEGGVYRIK